MSGNDAFELVTESGWRRGLNNLLDNENSRWWKTRLWWRQSLIWGGVIGVLLATVLFKSPDLKIADGYMIYAVFAGIFPAIAGTIIMQGVMIGEKKSGTAAWVLSKPVSRAAFVLSKLLANGLGALVTMVLLPGVIAFGLFFVRTGVMPNPFYFLAALGGLFLNLLFYLTLTLMLGVVSNSRGAVIGIPLAFLGLQQYLLPALPFLRFILPMALVLPLGDKSPATVPMMLSGQLGSSNILILVVALECIVFVLISLWRFEQEEF